MPKPWDVKKVTISWSVFGSASWIESLLEKRFVHEFHKVVDDSMFDFAHKLLLAYRYIEDVFPDKTDLIFRNDIIDVKATMDNQYMSIGFDTNITVDQHFVKKLYRRMNGTIHPYKDFVVCMSAQMVPDVLDVMGKAGHYDSLFSPELWGFENDSMSHIIELIPSLAERYTYLDTFEIGCHISSYHTINDIKERKSEQPELILQQPSFCFVKVKIHEEYPLTMEIYLKLHYGLFAHGSQYVGQVGEVRLMDFKTDPALPYTKKEILNLHVLEFAKMLKNTELVSPGIQVVPTRNQSLTLADAIAHDEEICWLYDENVPI